MKEITRKINKHYGNIDISARILKALKDSGNDLKNLTTDDLASFDEFHTGGKESTMNLATLAGISAGTQVLDIGSGIGGPARTLASEFNCSVSGIDLTIEFCRAARLLTNLVGLSPKVNFQYGDAVYLPFKEQSFDFVWSQNTLMNIPDKVNLFKEIIRVLTPGGIFAFETVLAGEAPGMIYPSFWASSEELNFLISEQEIKSLLKKAKLAEVHWADHTSVISQRSAERVKNLKYDPLKLTGRNIIVKDDVELKIRNSALNFKNKHVISVSAVYKKLRTD